MALVSVIGRLRTWYAMVFLFVYFFIVAFTPTYATAVFAQNAAISQGYETQNTNVVPDALVSLTSQDTVDLATVHNVYELVGIIGKQPLVELSNSASSSQVQVITQGTAPTVVSDINGAINAGAKITASPIDGVGMKATLSGQIVGTAQASLSSVPTHTETITNIHGQQESVKVGVIPVEVSVAYFSIPSTGSKTKLEAQLQDIAGDLIGKSVSLTRAFLALFVLVVGFVGVGLIIYSSVRSSIISIGRNPLSQGAINHSLLEVGLVVLGILLVMVITIYLILTT